MFTITFDIGLQFKTSWLGLCQTFSPCIYFQPVDSIFGYSGKCSTAATLTLTVVSTSAFDYH